MVCLVSKDPSVMIFASTMPNFTYTDLVYTLLNKANALGTEKLRDGLLPALFTTLMIVIADVNSMYDCGDIGDGPEMDDPSLSSRASSRIFDSDQIYSAESMHGM